MTKAQHFIEALRAGDPGRRPKTVADHWDQLREWWLADLKDLNALVRAWLAPVLADHLASVDDKPFDLTEPDVGAYTAPGLALKLTVGGHYDVVVLVRPRGVRVVGVVGDVGRPVVGANGRVDLEAGAKREILLRFKSDEGTAWRSFSGGKKRDLDEEVFFDLLANVTDLDIR